ncbi:MAG: insulinase family protein [Bacteroidaceae bacterium]|nr:insulinase family protein [Bacteroidaceae bacterium]
MMQINRHRLANGLRLVHIHDTASQMVYVNLLYGVGARNESPEYTGIAHLFEHLMFEGTSDVPSFDEPLECAGGENNAYTTNDITNYYMSLPRQNAELAFWLESDRMCNVQLTDESVSVQRQVVVEEFKQSYLNCPYGDVSMILRSMAYKTHPYRWSTIGRKTSHISTVPVELLREFYSLYYAPDNAVLSVVGNLSFEEAVGYTEKWFGAIPAKGVKPLNLPMEKRQNRIRRRTVRRSVPENALYMAFHMGARTDADYFPCDVISDILANGYSGRLKSRLVERKRIFTKIDAYIAGSEDPGLFRISGRVAPGISIEKAEEAVWHELELLKNKIVPMAEMRKVRNRFESEFTFRNLNRENLAGNIALFEWRGCAEELFNEVNNYRAVTAERVRATARELFRKGNCSVLYYMKK